MPSIPSQKGNNTSFDPAYNKANFGPPHASPMFDGSPGNPNVTIDDTKTDDSQNPITPAHVSSESISLMAPGFESIPKAVHVTPWWGSGSHPDIGFPDFRDNDYIDAFLAEIFTTYDFDYVIYDWYGQGSFEDGSVLAVNARATATSFTDYKYMVMIDAGAIAGTGSTATTNLINAITYCNTHYFGDSRYIKVAGRPVLMFFGVSQISGINMVTAKTAAASLGNPLFIDNGTSVFGTSWGDGGFAWLGPYKPPGTPINPADPYHVHYLDGFVSAANAHPTKYLWLSAWAGFDGTCTRSSGWSLGKILQRDGGTCWLQSWAYSVTQAGLMANPARLAGWQVPSYNDHQEGTGIEEGIENWATVTASVVGDILSWDVTFGVSGVSQTVTADLSTVSHFNVWYSTDDATDTLAGTFPVRTLSLDLTTIAGVSQDTPYYLYVEAVGIPCVRSHMNAVAATWTWESPDPTAAFSAIPSVIIVGEASILTWATTNATSVSIDHGMGTVYPVAGGSVSAWPTATTTYTLTATGPGGVATSSATVTVHGEEIVPTYESDILPSTTGIKLGNSVQRWDVYASNVSVAGDLAYSPVSGLSYAPEGVLLATGAVVTANQNTLLRQTLQAYTIPAGALNAVGSTIRFTAYGTYQTQAGQTPRFRVGILLGGILILDIATVETEAASPERWWKIEGLAVVVSAGTSGSLESHGTFGWRADSTQTITPLCDLNLAPIGSFDLTVAQVLTIGAVFGTNTSPANICKLRQFVVEILN